MDSRLGDVALTLQMGDSKLTKEARIQAMNTLYRRDSLTAENLQQILDNDALHDLHDAARRLMQTTVPVG